MPTCPQYQSDLFDFVPLYSTRLVREEDMQYSFQKRLQVSKPEPLAHFLFEYFADKANEEFIVVLLDRANTVMGLHRASTGGLSASIVEPREIFRAAILSNASSIILAHNHPSGNPEPSRQDIKITQQLVEAGKVMGIPVYDHLIITDDKDGYTSLTRRGVMDKAA